MDRRYSVLILVISLLTVAVVPSGAGGSACSGGPGDDAGTGGDAPDSFPGALVGGSCLIGTLEDAGDEDHYLLTHTAFSERFWAEEGCFEVTIIRPTGATSTWDLCEGQGAVSLLALPATGTQLVFRGGPAVYGFGT